MGRKPITKFRRIDNQTTANWVENLSPDILLNGFKHLNMENIVGQAGISKATFYKYFASREELIAQIVSTQVSKLSKFKEKLFNPKLPMAERYSSAMLIAAGSLAIVSVRFLEDLEATYPSIHQKLEAFLHDTGQWSEIFYREAKEQGFIRDINIGVLTLMDLGFFRELIRTKDMQHFKLDVLEAYLNYVEIRTYAIVANKKDCDAIMARLRAMKVENDLLIIN
jgi:AcrR family transcriptional regulator